MILVLGIPIGLPIAGIFLPFIHGYYIYKSIFSNENEQDWWERDSKRFKSLTMIFESIPQLIFTSYCYVRAFHEPQRSYGELSWYQPQIISMIISSLSIFQGLLSRHCYPYRRSQNFGLSCDLAKTFVLISLDMVLKLSVITMSVFIAGVELTLCWVFLFTILLLVTNIVHNLNDYQLESENNDNALVNNLQILLENSLCFS